MEQLIDSKDDKGSVENNAKVINDDNVSENMGTKDTSIGVRVDDELLAILEKLAREDDRPLASMARKLIVEALRARGEKI